MPDKALTPAAQWLDWYRAFGNEYAVGDPVVKAAHVIRAQASEIARLSSELSERPTVAQWEAMVTAKDAIARERDAHALAGEEGSQP